MDDPVERLRLDIVDLRHELHVLGLDSAVLRNKLDNLERDITLISTSAIPRLVPVDRFALVEKVVYGTVGLILSSFMLALAALVVKL